MSHLNPSTVACLGPEGSFSHEFAIAKFPSANPKPIEGGFTEVVAEVESGRCEVAVLPFLNSNGVDVRPAQAAVAAARDWISVDGCFPHSVVHNLVVTEKFKALKRVTSKEQVFPQCTTWLSQWGEIEQVSAASTSAALVELLKAPISEQEVSGAICNELARGLYGGVLKYPEIQNHGNVTLFLTVSKRRPTLAHEEVLICLTCPTEECYKSAVNDFAAAGFPLKFTSLKGEFTADLPSFLQFEFNGAAEKLQHLLNSPHRHLLGDFPSTDSLAACVGGFFDDIY